MSSPPERVFVGCHVIDGVNAVPVPDAAVRVAGGRITAVGARATVVADARRDDLTDLVGLGGAFLTPGLINFHTHFSLGLPGNLGVELDRMTAHDLALYRADGARCALESGIERTAARRVRAADVT